MTTKQLTLAAMLSSTLLSTAPTTSSAQDIEIERISPTVKTCTFNGIAHPAIVLKHLDGTRQTLRHFTYEDYRDRMD